MTIDVPVHVPERLTGATSLGEIALRSAERHAGDALTAPSRRPTSYIAGDLASIEGDERVRAALQRDVDAVNARFARIEQIKRFDVLDHDFTQAEGELTPTLKVKRAVIYARYADRFDRLYGARAPSAESV